MAAKLHHLSNGVPVIIDTVPHVNSATVGFYLQVGSRHEEEHENGTAHFLEHMGFKGTKNRTARQLNVEIENMGAKANAFTSQKSTCYYIKGLAEDAPRFIEILNDMVQNSALPEDEVIRERGTILQEISISNDDPDDVVNDIVEKAAHENQPVGRSILGPKENIETMSREQLRAFMDKHYHAGNLIVSIAGNVDTQQILTQLEDTVGKMKARPKSSFQTAARSPGGHVHKEMPIEQLRMVMSFDSAHLSDPDFWNAGVLANILGGGMSSRLFEEIREKRGLVYTVYAMASALENSASFEIYAGTGPEKMSELLPVLCDELKKVCTDGVTEEELARTKKQILVGLANRDESMGSRMIGPAEDLQHFGRIRSAEEVAEAFKAVTLESVKAYANKLFSRDPVIATVGPSANIDLYQITRDKLKL